MGKERKQTKKNLSFKSQLCLIQGKPWFQWQLYQRLGPLYEIYWATQGTQWYSLCLPSLCLFAGLTQNVHQNYHTTGNIFCRSIVAIYLANKKSIFYLENCSRNSWPSLFNGAGGPWFESKNRVQQTAWPLVHIQLPSCWSLIKRVAELLWGHLVPTK